MQLRSAYRIVSSKQNAYLNDLCVLHKFLFNIHLLLLSLFDLGEEVCMLYDSIRASNRTKQSGENKPLSVSLDKKRKKEIQRHKQKFCLLSK